MNEDIKNNIINILVEMNQSKEGHKLLDNYFKADQFKVISEADEFSQARDIIGSGVIPMGLE